MDDFSAALMDEYFLRTQIQATKCYLILKRFFDIIASLLGICLLLPAFILVAIIIKLDSKGPVLFRQIRSGQYGKTFRMIKFRTMQVDSEHLVNDLIEKNEADGPVFKIRNDPRVTRTGRILRKASIDEFPQLVNVLKGEMSLVGPRPPLPSEVAQYTHYQRQRLLVKPGLTCYWQISGRSDLSFEEWVELDLKYIKERSVGVDIALILLTIPAVWTGKGAY